LRDGFLEQFEGDVSVVNTREEERAMQSTTEKRPYTTPTLTVHGTLEEVTKLQNKGWGSSDGFLFEGVPITNIS
jgi:hypothetical protein